VFDEPLRRLPDIANITMSYDSAFDSSELAKKLALLYNNCMNLCLISSNIRFDNPADGQNAWANRRNILADTLLAHSPDIIATQEGRYHQLEDFKELLKDYLIIDEHRSWIKERMYPTLFIKRDVFEVLRSEDLWLSETPQLAGSRSFDSAFPRLMTWMKVQPKNSHVNFLVVNTHLDHVKSETRLGQINVLKNEVKKILDPSSSLIIMGDFNDSPDSEVRKSLLEGFPTLQDAWKLFNATEETSHHAFNGICENGSRIDWVMLDQKVKVESCILDKKTSNGHYPSDHFPVICHIKF
jgi:endonuclease/exonuclease/phosphatase family metal-dependent hydrolase